MDHHMWSQWDKLVNAWYSDLNHQNVKTGNFSSIWSQGILSKCVIAKFHFMIKV